MAGFVIFAEGFGEFKHGVAIPVVFGVGQAESWRDRVYGRRRGDFWYPLNSFEFILRLINNSAFSSVECFHFAFRSFAFGRGLRVLGSSIAAPHSA